MQNVGLLRGRPDPRQICTLGVLISHQTARGGIPGALCTGCPWPQTLWNWTDLNPYHSGAWDVTFNTTSSFVTNANWQYYSGETTMSYFSQMAGLTVQDFLSAGYVGFTGPTHLPNTITQGPVASQEVIKELETNGGGFFDTNSPHPTRC